MPQPLLSGEAPTQERSGPDDRDLIIKGLRAQLADAEESARGDRVKLAQIEGGIRELRSILLPLHSVLKDVFGEMNAMGITEGVSSASTTAAAAGPGNAKWEAIKKHHPGRLAEAIDILLAHGTMNNSQLATALHMNRNSCSTNIVPKLRQLGLIVGAREFSLKNL